MYALVLSVLRREMTEKDKKGLQCPSGPGALEGTTLIKHTSSRAGGGHGWLFNTPSLPSLPVLPHIL